MAYVKKKAALFHKDLPRDGGALVQDSTWKLMMVVIYKK